MLYGKIEFIGFEVYSKGTNCRQLYLKLKSREDYSRLKYFKLLSLLKGYLKLISSEPITKDRFLPSRCFSIKTSNMFIN